MLQHSRPKADWGTSYEDFTRLGASVFLGLRCWFGVHSLNSGDWPHHARALGLVRMIQRDVLRVAAATAHDALICLAWAYEDAGFPDKKNAIMQIRKQLIDATRIRGGSR